MINLNDELIVASKYGHLEVVKFLVEKGANIHADNNLALRCASKYGHLEIVKFLVKNGADIHADNDRVLKLASLNGHFEVVEYLKSLSVKSKRQIRIENLQNELDELKKLEG
jgi:ankyrin repeat protein